ncbi:unnamed protein product, partial [Prunus brigantina]
VGTAQYNLVPPAASGLSRPWSCTGYLWSEDPEGATPAGLEVAAGPVAHRSMGLSAGQLEQGSRPLRPSRAALDKRCRFDRGAYVVPSEWPNRNEGESVVEITTPVMVKWSDCSDRTVVTKQRSRCLGQDGSGRPRCELDRFAGPRNAWGCFSPMIWPEHGVGRTPFLLGRSVRDLPMLARIAPNYLSAAENAGRSLMLGCCQRYRGCCFCRRAPTSRALGFSVRLWESLRTTLPASSPERARDSDRVFGLGDSDR